MLLPDNIRHLLDFFENFLEGQTKLLYHLDTPLHEACRYALNGQGKRIRPLLLLLSNQACGGSSKLALAPALGVEMIHTYSLIHDDLPIMDNDDFRRGRPTVHKVFDEVTALLAGDALLTDAFKMLLSTDIAPHLLVDMVKTLSAASGGQGMVLGQDQDIYWTARSNYTDEALTFIHKNKTAKLMGAACRLGALSAGASQTQAKALFDFGMDLGLAFQIIDDLLDQEAGTGKSQGKDQDQGKLTYLSLMSYDEAYNQAKTITSRGFEGLQIFGTDADDLRTLGEGLLGRKL